MDDKHRRALNKKQLYLEKQLDSEDIHLVIEYLYDNGVIREKVKQDILAQSQEQAKARFLLDCLPQRGHKAFVTFIGSLVYAKKDWLAKDLLKVVGEADLRKFFKKNGLDPPKPAPRTQEDEDEYYDRLDTSTDIEVKVQLVTDKRMKDRFDKNDSVFPNYSMQKRRRGIVLIISNVKVSGKEDRFGTEKDENHMKQLFEGLGFYAVSRRDRTVKNMIKDIMECTNGETNPDAFVLVIMSHGEICKVEGSEGNSFLHYDRIKELLSDLHAPKLAGKPKLVIIQACQTVNPGSTVLENSPKEAFTRSGDHLDQLIVTSTIAGHSAFRDTEKGSGFIRFITMVFMRHACSVDISDLFTKVQDLMYKRRPHSNSQTPETDRVTMRKKLFFFPGLWRE